MNGNRKKLLLRLLFLSTLLLILNVTALKLHLYWTTWWMDVINHFLGGVIVAYSYVILLSFKPEGTNIFNRKSFLVGLIYIFLVGVLWEIFELYFSLTFIDSTRYWEDTFIDMVMDVVGMVTAYMYLSRKN